MKMLEDLAEVVWLDGPEGRYDAACIKALRLIRTHAAEIERNARDVEEMRKVLKLALEYWADRQQRYKNRHPVWTQRAYELMREWTNQSEV